MSKQKKRTYNSETRCAQALHSRRRILEAAQQLFHTYGFEDTTIDQIAKKAEVSAPYIYALFKSKKGIMAALLGETLPVEQNKVMLQNAKPLETAQNVLRETAKRARTLYEKEAIRTLTSASLLSAELHELEQQKQEGRREREKAVVTWMFRQGVIKKEFTLEQARDIVWGLTSPDLYRLFVVERKWTAASYEAWLSALLITALLE